MVEELTEFDEEFLKKEKELIKKQLDFELKEKLRSEELTELEKKEEKKNKILTWAVLFGIFLLILFLIYKWFI